MRHEIKEYIAKPAAVEALQWNGDDAVFETLTTWTSIPTGETKIQRVSRNVLWLDESDDTEDVQVRIGDWIIKQGNSFRRVEEEHFYAIYSPVEGVV